MVAFDNLHPEISQLKETESQLAKTLSLMRGTLDSTAYGTIAVSYEGEVLSHNQKFLEMWKIPDSLVLSKDSESCQNFFDRQLKNPEVFHRSVWEVSRESEAETYDILELKDGRVFAQYSKPQRLDDKIHWQSLEYLGYYRTQTANRIRTTENSRQDRYSSGNKRSSTTKRTAIAFSFYALPSISLFIKHYFILLIAY